MKFKIAIFGIFLLSVFLRIHNIESKNLWYDEVYSWKISQGSISEIVSEASGDIHPPFYYVILKLWTGIFSDSVFSMRMLSAVLGILSLFFIYRISFLLFKDKLQIIFILIMYAVSPLNIFYSQEIRMLNLNLFLTLGSVYFFYKLIEIKSLKYSLIYILFTVFSLYTHYFALLILFTEVMLVLIIFALKKSNTSFLKKYFLSFIAINIFYLPWYPVFFEQTSKGQPWRTQLTTPEAVLNTVTFFKDIFLSPYFSYESGAVHYFSNFLVLFLFAFIIFSMFKLINSGSWKTDKEDSVICFFIVPLAAASIISLNQSILLSRYLSITIPYLFMMLVLFSFKIYKRTLASIICIFFVLVNCRGSVIYYDNEFKNNDYRKIVSYIEDNFEPGDKIIVEPHFMGWYFDYHIKHSNSNLNNPEIFGWNLKMQLDSLCKRGDISKVWMINDYSSLDKSNYDSLSNYMNNLGFVRMKSRIFYPVPDKVKVEYYRIEKP